MYRSTSGLPQRLNTPARPLSQWIRRYPVGAYLLLAFGLAWGCFLLAPLAGHTAAVTRINLLGLAMPALSAMLVARISMPTQRTGRRFARGTLFIFLFAACGWLLLSHRRGEVMTPRLLLLDIGLAALAAMILSAAGARQTGIHGLMRPLLHWRIGPQWYLLALLLFPGLSLLGALISWGPGLTSLLVQPFSPPQQWPGLLLGSLLNTCLFAGPLGAEPGWRGFLLPRLQERNSPLLAALQIGVIWTAWQIPLYLNGFYPALPQDVPNMLLARLGLNMLLSIVLTWLILRSRGSLLLAILMHASFLLSLQLIPLNNATLLLGAVTALAIVVAERLWRRSDALG